MLATPMTVQPYFRDFDDLSPPDIISQEQLQDVRHVTHNIQSSDDMLDILSAAVYPNAPPRSTKKRKSSNQLFGGIIPQVNEPEDDVRRVQPRKKSRKGRDTNLELTNDDSDSSHKKQRGRPRLEPQDETAADRRRTQIRLAQRAYRDRKESTISTLNSQVKELREIIESMNSSFVRLHDNAVNSNSQVSSRNGVFTRQLKTTMNEFTELVRRASLDPDQNEETDKIARFNAAMVQVVPSSNKNSADSYTSPPITVASYQIEQDTVDEDVHSYDTELHLSGPLNWSLQTKLDVARWSGQVQRPIETDGPYTYSFQETTFARRLHRAALEHGYRHMSNPSLDPVFIKRAFRFTFTFSNQKRVLSRLQDLLKRKAGESLENWNVPYFYIGGAGTHFPRYDEKGNAVFPPNMIGAARALGPFEQVNVETRISGKTTEELLQMLGFDGVWFDSHDVEGYLRSRGVHLDAQSSFVGVDASILSESPTQTQTSRTFGVQQDASDLFNMTDLSFEPSTTGSSGLDMENWNWSGEENDESSTRRSINFDVERFLERLLAKSVCLGRAPGFKRSDVDEALIYATLDTF